MAGRKHERLLVQVARDHAADRYGVQDGPHGSSTGSYGRPQAASLTLADRPGDPQLEFAGPIWVRLHAEICSLVAQITLATHARLR
jgi:hypothetical protein